MPDKIFEGREKRGVGQPPLRGLRDSEIDHLRDRFAVVPGDEDVRRFQIAVDDPFLVGVLHGVADRDEEPEPFRGGLFLLVAIVGDAHAAHELHDEKRPAGGGGAGIEDPRDRGVIHHRQRLPLRFETRDDGRGVHAKLDDFQRDLAADGLALLGAKDRAAAALADFFEQVVTSNLFARGFGGPRRGHERGGHEISGTGGLVRGQH